MVFLKEFFEKVDFEKNQQTTKKHEKLPRMQTVKSAYTAIQWGYMSKFLSDNSSNSFLCVLQHYLGLDATKPVLGVSDKVRVKPACSAIVIN